MDETGILLNEAHLATLDEAGKPAFIYDWLQRLSKILTNLTSSLQSAKPNLSHKEQETYINDKGKNIAPAFITLITLNLKKT